MKKLLYILCAFVIGAHNIVSAQEIQTNNSQIAPTECPENYKLYPTENVWTFLKLDTRTGKVWQIQYDINGKNFGEVNVMDSDLTLGDKVVTGRFELYPTQNICTFLLLDKKNGTVIQFQWSLDSESRGFVRFISYGN